MSQPRPVFAFLVMLAWLAGPPVTAQTPDFSFELKRFDINAGLPQNEVTAIVQTPDRNLWLGTFGGLVRFDGTNFEVFDLSTHPEIGSNRILSLLVARDGALWIGTEDEGVVRYFQGQFTQIPSANPAAPTLIWTLLEDSSGVIWAGSDQGLARYDGEQMVMVPGFQSAVQSLTETKDGRLWVGANDGLICYFENTAQRLVERFGARRVTKLKDGSVVCGFVGGRLQRWTHEEGKFRSEPFLRFNKGFVFSVFEDSRDAIWISCENSVHRRLPDGSMGSLEMETVGGRFARTIYEDHEGSIWLGGWGGLWRARSSPIHSRPVSNSSEAANCIVASGEGDLYIATQAGSIRRWDGKSWVAITRTGPDAPTAHCFAPSQDGSIWATSEKGLWNIKERGRVITRVNAPTASGARSALLEDSAGHLWISAVDRLYCRPRGSRIFREIDIGKSVGRIFAILESRRGGLWLGGEDGLARLLDDRISRAWNNSGDLPPGSVRGLWEDENGHLWGGTYGGGLFHLNYRNGDITTLNMKHGLRESTVSRIVPDDRGNLILQGNRAISVVNLAQLEDVVAGRRRRLEVRAFNAGAGIQVFEGMGGSMPLSCRDTEGLLWFPALEGPVAFNAARLSAPLSPPSVRIDLVEVDGREFGPNGKIIVPPGRRDVSVAFSAQTFIDPGQAEFRYRLVGYEDEWIYSGNRREAIFTGVPAGSYEFQVAAASRDGVWSDAYTPLEFQLDPRFSETIWFQVLLGVLAIALIWFIVALRTRETKRYAQTLENQVAARTSQLVESRNRLEERVEERTRQLREDIAKRELLENQLGEAQKFEAVGRLAGGIAHDFNNILTAVIGEADFVRTQLDKGDAGSPEVRSSVNEITNASIRAARLTNQLLAYSRQQVLNPTLIHTNETIDVLRPMLMRMCPSTIDLVFDLASGLPQIRVDASQLEQVLINLVLNAIDATGKTGRIVLSTRTAELSPEKLSALPEALPGTYVHIAVVDKGCGIPSEIVDQIFEPFFTTKAPGQGTGLGLASVYGIVSQSGGLIEVESTVGEGTTFDVFFPADTAEKPPSPAVTSSEKTGPEEGDDARR